jgi:hypothetical protein
MKCGEDGPLGSAGQKESKSLDSSEIGLSGECQKKGLWDMGDGGPWILASGKASTHLLCPSRNWFVFFHLQPGRIAVS